MRPLVVKHPEPPGRFRLPAVDPHAAARCKNRRCHYLMAHRCGKCFKHCVCHA